MTVVSLSEYRPYIVNGAEIVVRDDGIHSDKKFYFARLLSQTEFTFIGMVGMSDEVLHEKIERMKNMHSLLSE